MKFIKCEKCGKVAIIAKDSACDTMCCGQAMTVLKPNTTDAAVEKHVPVIEANGSKVTVKVGSVEHPMLAEHYIEWILIETSQGYQKKDLKPGDKPEAVFALAEGETLVAAYDYCSLHGLWSAKA
ncbi:MAG: desulfoferrodoxin [Lachnospiraceae bacterium]|uniref:Desulfoferrodoxin n=1 Tax=Candidatus Weimeria bifida TaxID=2599074 RepID=A0A6N7IWP4_9FIRM|nr:desulfoferrodoxin [Candidatus Weimeria bifida]RRF95763.1 MAG: desulfoferrodoxin [Lachnospiraceae bacterium]